MPGNHGAKNENPQDEEEDYMSMIIEEPPQRETFAQRKLRKQREVSNINPYGYRSYGLGKNRTDQFGTAS